MAEEEPLREDRKAPKEKGEKKDEIDNWLTIADSAPGEHAKHLKDRVSLL